MIYKSHMPKKYSHFLITVKYLEKVEHRRWFGLKPAENPAHGGRKRAISALN